MEWREDGLLLSRRAHGESGLIIEAFTQNHGRHAGIVRGGGSRKMSAALQPGSQLDLTWRARLEDHLGTFTTEPRRSRAHLMSDRETLAGLNAISGLLSFALPEREPHPQLYMQTLTVLDLMETEAWLLAYLRWELSLLEEVGFGLDLERCAVTGETEELAYVSPKSGRAVSKGPGADWADRLLPLSPALTGNDTSRDALRDGLRTTGYFLQHRLAPALGQKPLPQVRQRLVDLVIR